MARVTGLGGAFYRSPNPQRTVDWYTEHLGIVPEMGHPSATMHYSGGETAVWAPFAADTDYFGPDQQFMVNFRVDDLVALVEQLRAAGVEIVRDNEFTEYGIFGWIIDCDGNRVELWQPPDGQ